MPTQEFFGPINTQMKNKQAKLGYKNIHIFKATFGFVENIAIVSIYGRLLCKQLWALLCFCETYQNSNTKGSCEKQPRVPHF